MKKISIIAATVFLLISTPAFSFDGALLEEYEGKEIALVGTLGHPIKVVLLEVYRNFTNQCLVEITAGGKTSRYLVEEGNILLPTTKMTRKERGKIENELNSR